MFIILPRLFGLQQDLNVPLLHQISSKYHHNGLSNFSVILQADNLLPLLILCILSWHKKDLNWEKIHLHKRKYKYVRCLIFVY